MPSFIVTLYYFTASVIDKILEETLESIIVPSNNPQNWKSSYWFRAKHAIQFCSLKNIWVFFNNLVTLLE